MHKSLFIALNFITCYSQIDIMTNNSVLILNKKLLTEEFNNYSPFFKKITSIEAGKMGIYPRLNYLYKGKNLLFLNREVKKLAIEVLDGKINRIHFEIVYNQEDKITNELIKLYGYPTGGRMNPSLPKLKDSTKSNTDLSNYNYENFSALSWSRKEEASYISVTNLKHNEYFINKMNTLWIHFALKKSIKQ